MVIAQGCGLILCSSALAHVEVYFSKSALGLGLAPFFSESASLVSFLAFLGSTDPISHLHRGPCPYFCLWETELNNIRVRRASVEKGPPHPVLLHSHPPIPTPSLSILFRSPLSWLPAASLGSLLKAGAWPCGSCCLLSPSWDESPSAHLHLLFLLIHHL